MLIILQKCALVLTKFDSHCRQKHEQQMAGDHRRNDEFFSFHLKFPEIIRTAKSMSMISL